MTSDLDVKDLLYSTDEMSVLFVPRGLMPQMAGFGNTGRQWEGR